MLGPPSKLGLTRSNRTSKLEPAVTHTLNAMDNRQNCLEWIPANGMTLATPEQAIDQSETASVRQLINRLLGRSPSTAKPSVDQ